MALKTYLSLKVPPVPGSTLGTMQMTISSANGIEKADLHMLEPPLETIQKPNSASSLFRG